MRVVVGIVSFFLLITFSSCSGDNSVAIPDDVLTPEEISQVLTEIQIVEARYQRRLYSPKTEMKTLALEDFRKVLRKNGLTPQEFKESFDFYKQYPELLSEVYEKSIENLTLMQAEAQATLKEEVQQKRLNKSAIDSSEQKLRKFGR